MRTERREGRRGEGRRKRSRPLPARQARRARLTWRRDEAASLCLFAEAKRGGGGGAVKAVLEACDEE